MISVVKRAFRFCTSAVETLPYPFTGSFRGQPAQLEDLRFSMYMADQPLNKFEIEHVNNIVGSVLTNITHQHTGLSKENNSWVDVRLQETLVRLKRVLRDRDMQLSISRRQQKDQLVSSGFLKVQGLTYPSKQHMHELEFIREGQLLRCVHRDLPKQPKDSEEDIQEELKKRFSKSSEEVEQFKKALLEQNEPSPWMQTFKHYLEKSGNYIFNMKTTNEGKLVGDGWLARLRKRQAPPSLTIDQIDVPVEWSLSRRGKELEQNSCMLRTRWLYVLNEKEAESVKRDRKRVLFDVENWMHGWFVPLRHFYHREQPVKP